MKTLRDFFVEIIAGRINDYCKENGMDPATFEYDLDEFELLSVGDVMDAFIRFGAGFDQARFLKDIHAALGEVANHESAT